MILATSFLVLVLQLTAELPLGATVLARSFLAGAVDLLLPLVVNDFVVSCHGGQQLLQFTLKDTIAEIVPLQTQQLLYLSLQLGVFEGQALIVEPLTETLSVFLTQQQKFVSGLLRHQLPVIVELFLTPALFLQRLPHRLRTTAEQDKVVHHLLPQE